MKKVLLFVLGSVLSVVCFSGVSHAAAGNILWSFTAAASIDTAKYYVQATPVIEKRVVLGLTNKLGTTTTAQSNVIIVSLDATNGNVLWSQNFPGKSILSVDAVNDKSGDSKNDLVISFQDKTVASSQNILYLDGTNGQILYSITSTGNIIPSSSSSNYFVPLAINASPDNSTTSTNSRLIRYQNSTTGGNSTVLAIE